MLADPNATFSSEFRVLFGLVFYGLTCSAILHLTIRLKIEGTSISIETGKFGESHFHQRSANFNFILLKGGLPCFGAEVH